MDELAVELGIDPLEIREKNWIKHEEFPFTTVAGLEYDSGNYEAATAQAKELFGYDELRGRAGAAPRRRRPRPARHRHLDLHRDVRARAVPGAGLARLRRRRLGARERADAGHRQGRGRHRRLRRTARATRRRSARSSPTGSVWRSRTSRCCTATPRSRHKGLDTYGSRSLAVGGVALVKAADKVIEKAKPIAAHLLEASVDDIEFSAGRFSVRGTDQGMAIGGDRAGGVRGAQPARRRRAQHRRDATYDPVNFTFPHGTHLCAIEVDTETGAREDPQVRLRRRHRQHHQPDDRRGPGARRAGAGHRPGAVRGGGVRRRRQPVSGLVRRLPAADRGRHAASRSTTRRRLDHQHAGHQGRRRGRHDRLDPGRRQRGRRRRAPVRGQRHPDAVHARAGVAAIHAQERPGGARPRGDRRRTVDEHGGAA